jgi:transposase InsO family protein
MVAEQETAELAEQLIADTATKESIAPGTLTLHADRGSSMRSKAVAALLGDLGITKSHSRPYISDDNPYSEAQFKTMKYQPGFPARFGSLADARAHCAEFFTWYNRQHRHSGIRMVRRRAFTPAVPPKYASSGRPRWQTPSRAHKPASNTACRRRKSCRQRLGSTRRIWRKRSPDKRDLGSHRFTQVFQSH